MLKRGLPYELFGWCSLILVSAFMPWSANSYAFPFAGSVSAVATGWSGNLNLILILIPNWVAVVIAAALAAMGWARTKEVEIKPAVSSKLALAGAIHAGVFIAWIVVFSRPPIVGLGAIATLAAFIALTRYFKRSALSAVAVENLD